MLPRHNRLIVPLLITVPALFGSVTAEEETTERGKELWERMITRMLDDFGVVRSE